MKAKKTSYSATRLPACFHQDGLHQQLPFWYGCEDSDHIQLIIQEYERILSVNSPRGPVSRRPKQFIGRISRYYLFCDTSKNVLVTIDEVNVFRLVLLPKGMHLPSQQMLFTRTFWNIEDGVPIKIDLLQDQQIQKELLGSCSYLYAEPKWNTNFYQTESVEYEYRVSKVLSQIGYAGWNVFSDCYRNSFENLHRMNLNQQLRSPSDIKKQFKWKIDDEENDDEGDNEYEENYDEIIEFDPNEPIIKKSELITVSDLNDKNQNVNESSLWKTEEISSFTDLLSDDDDSEDESDEEISDDGDDEEGYIIESCSSDEEEDDEDIINNEQKEEEEEFIIEDEEDVIFGVSDILVEEEELREKEKTRKKKKSVKKFVNITKLGGDDDDDPFVVIDPVPMYNTSDEFCYFSSGLLNKNDLDFFVDNNKTITY